MLKQSGVSCWMADNPEKLSSCQKGHSISPTSIFFFSQLKIHFDLVCSPDEN